LGDSAKPRVEELSLEGKEIKVDASRRGKEEPCQQIAFMKGADTRGAKMPDYREGEMYATHAKQERNM